MAQTVKVDKQGRLVLPAHIRTSMGLKHGGEVFVRLDGQRAVIEPVSEDLEENVKAWKESTLKLQAEPFTQEVPDSWKWMSREYARRKLGFS